MGLNQNLRDISTHGAALDAARTANEIAGPKSWQAQLVTTDAGHLVVRVRKLKAWTQASVTSITPPQWGEFAPFPCPIPDRKIARAITKGVS